MNEEHDRNRRGVVEQWRIRMFSKEMPRILRQRWSQCSSLGESAIAVPVRSTEAVTRSASDLVVGTGLPIQIPQSPVRCTVAFGNEPTGRYRIKRDFSPTSVQLEDRWVRRQLDSTECDWNLKSQNSDPLLYGIRAVIRSVVLHFGEQFVELPIG